MSPTTLYREGTDLDGLLAELDSRYPGQVRVVEVTHPREGGVLGFFAKQRVGVHYRLIDESDTTAPVLEHDAVPDARSRGPVPERVAATAPGGGTSRSGGNDAAPLAGSAGPARPGVLRDGFGPDPAAIRAALAHRAAGDRGSESTAAVPPSTAAPQSTAAHRPSVAHRDDANTAAAEQPSRTGAIEPPAPGMQFAQLLADIALKKAAAGAVPSPAAGLARQADRPAPAARPDAARPEPAPTPSPAIPVPAAEAPGVPATGAGPVTSAAATFAAMDFAALTSFSTVTSGAAPATASGTPVADAATVATPVATTSLTAPGAPAITLRRRSGRAVPQVGAPSPAAADTAAQRAAAGIGATPGSTPAPTAAGDTTATSVALAFTALPRIATAGSAAHDAAPHPAAKDDLDSGLPAERVTDAAAPRPGALAWPLAAGNASAGRYDEHPAATDSARRPAGATALLERPAPVAAQPTTAAAAGLDAAAAEPVSMRAASYQAAGENAPAGHSTPLTLRRKLLEVGVPVDRVPSTAVHVYAAIEELVQGLAPAPELPTRPGQLLVLAGPARDVTAATDSLLAGNPGVFEATWTYGCPAALGTRRAPATTSAITSARHATDIAKEARASDTGPTLVAIATDTAPAESTTDVLAAVGADTVWAAVDATRKTADTRRALRAVPSPDAIVVTNAGHSGSPATVWELGLPIALVDGRPSTGPSWAVLLLGKLSELEESGCSGALC